MSVAGATWRVEVPQLQLTDAAKISNTTSLGLFCLKRGLSPTELAPQGRGHSTQDREHAQPCLPPACFNSHKS